MSDPDFEAIKQGLVSVLVEKDSNLYNRFSRLKQALDVGYTTFDRKAQLAKAVQSLSRTVMVDFYQQRLLDKGNGRVIVRSLGKAHSKEETLSGGCQTKQCAEQKMPSYLKR